MLYSRGAREVDAVKYDGSERSARDVSYLKDCLVSFRPDYSAEVSTTFGRKTLVSGQWITRDRATGACRVWDDSDFHVEHTKVG